MTEGFSHLDERGAARLVDVTGKLPTHRRAVARCAVSLSEPARRRLDDADVAEQVLGDARLVGAMAAKRAWDLIPLCHPIRLDRVEVAVSRSEDGVAISAVAEVFERTGVEIEALTACAFAALSIASEFAGTDPAPIVRDIALWEKSGGRTGTWRREDHLGAIDPGGSARPD